MGHDQLDSISIKSGGISLIAPIRHLVNLSLLSGKVAMKWKLSCLTPRLKSRELDRLSVSSYRPIAVLPYISKVAERVAQQQLMKFLEESEQINPSSHAYRKYYSTTTTLQEITDELYQGAEDKKITSIMTIDQSAAFDVVNHELLLQKLGRYNVGPGARKWIEDYLKWRTQYVTIGNAKSNMVPVDRGVPQGSVIGPLLFIIYTNELTELVKKTDCQDISHSMRTTLWGRQCSNCGIISQYADDTTYIVGNKSRQSNMTNLRRNLDEIAMFLEDNQLTINQGKTSLTETMIPQKRGKTPGTPPPQLDIRKPNGEVKTVNDATLTRILGANIQQNLNWQAHLETGPKALLPAVRQQLGRLRHQGNLIPLVCRPNLAKGLILSRLNYLLPLWGGVSKPYLRKAQVALNATARWATGLPKKTRIPDLMNAAGFLTIAEQMKIATLVQAWKIIHLGKPPRILERMHITEDLQFTVQRP